MTFSLNAVENCIAIIISFICQKTDSSFYEIYYRKHTKVYICFSNTTEGVIIFTVCNSKFHRLMCASLA